MKQWIEVDNTRIMILEKSLRANRSTFSAIVSNIKEIKQFGNI